MSVTFEPAGGDVTEEGKLQVRVHNEMDDDILKSVQLNISANDQNLKFVAVRMLQAGSRVIVLKDLVTKGQLPFKCDLKVIIGESILDDMAKRRGAPDTPQTKKKKAKQRLQKQYTLEFEAVGVAELPTGSVKDFWRRIEADESIKTARQTIIVNVKEKRVSKEEKSEENGNNPGTDGGAGVAEQAPDYVAISFFIFAILFAVYIFLQPIPEEILPPCNATLNITDHCINASALNETLSNITTVNEQHNTDNDAAASSNTYSDYVGNDAGEKTTEEHADNENDNSDMDVDNKNSHPHGDLRRRIWKVEYFNVVSICWDRDLIVSQKQTFA